MGVRLYPSGTFDEEVLVGVPKGTKERLIALGPCPNGNFALEEAWFDKLQADADANCLHNFQLFGWGRITPAVSEIIKAQDMDTVVGDTKEPKLVAHILAFQGVALPEGVTLEGVFWG